MPTLPPMAEIIFTVHTRLRTNLGALIRIEKMRDEVRYIEVLNRPGSVEKQTDHIGALVGFLAMLRSSMATDISMDVEQAAFLVARSIAEDARASIEPVCWITSNNMAPAIRNFDLAEVIYQADTSDDFFTLFYEALERKLDEQQVNLESPENDNSLYAVDLRRWERIDEDELTERDTEYNDEWRRIND